jgi:threonine dehydratase
MHAGLQLIEVISHIACEVSGREHGQKVIQQLEQNGYQTTME